MEWVKYGQMIGIYLHMGNDRPQKEKLTTMGVPQLEER
jgi:hypothetical protein